MDIDEKILFYDDDRDKGSAIIITLKSGYRFDRCDEIETILMFSTPEQVDAAMKKVVKC